MILHRVRKTKKPDNKNSDELNDNDDHNFSTKCKSAFTEKIYHFILIINEIAIGNVTDIIISARSDFAIVVINFLIGRIAELKVLAGQIFASIRLYARDYTAFGANSLVVY
ncbi:hypothetical protein [Candidiatus Paracoxiella cheracis]|uniref:hypothetical protein n=1 Tax=Candidiatus Paracoxiella cheracis TaxID=3405120 RepID=UPI003BF49064